MNLIAGLRSSSFSDLDGLCIPLRELCEEIVLNKIQDRGRGERRRDWGVRNRSFYSRFQTDRTEKSALFTPTLEQTQITKGLELWLRLVLKQHTPAG